MPRQPSSSATPSSKTSTVEVVPGGKVVGRITPPGSKSLTNRALVCAAFASGHSTLTGALESEDTEVMIDSLSQIGLKITVENGGQTIHIDNSQVPPDSSPLGSRPGEATRLFIANSGTTIRFLTAALSAAGGHYELRGVDRMHQRPIGDLVEAIRPILDGKIEALSKDGCPPVHLNCHGWKDGNVHVGGSVSSQYLSGLMMAAPIQSFAAKSSQATRSIRIIVDGELVSRPYVDMTAKVIESFGGRVDCVPSQDGKEDSLAFEISAAAKNGSFGYRGCDYQIEPDASAASYFLAAAAITGGQVTVNGLSRDAMQGDVGFADVLEQMGCDVDYQSDSITVTGAPLKGIDIDMNAISDTVQTLAVVALFAKGPTRVRGVAHNRFKETDRIGDLACELRKLGADAQEHDDGLTITPPPNVDMLHGATLATYHDHRMAMSLCLAGLKMEGVQIENPSCTSKTYPEFFQDLEKLIRRPHRWTQ
ncbi:3-phosphoshikimate 1-carboxyvinyltransferase [Novipirellula aureliae]|uniref:3-phosphoshikimate 1-carboxyvinyltransferase n=1 Tax=Novipirellula aureliae TaxID=2527966 RepID=A0A5C6E4K8_9BACT|nr:3-phosphoshikimate 1-carboxyvinyltransferase [Novipirellula aureliae]TWU43848.1 3-phosphoshikimate 1-carboxyvinyltransferase [Novipirellula aureliae]